MEAAFLSVNDCLDLFGFTLSVASGWRNEVIHKFERGFGRFGHLIFELPSGVVGEAEQFCLLGAELGEASDGGARIVVAAALGPGPGVFEERLARGAVSERGERRLLGGVLQRNDIALLVAGFGGLRQRRRSRHRSVRRERLCRW